MTVGALGLQAPIAVCTGARSDINCTPNRPVNASDADDVAPNLKVQFPNGVSQEKIEKSVKH